MCIIAHLVESDFVGVKINKNNNEKFINPIIYIKNKLHYNK
jgi:hypothetical protein